MSRPCCNAGCALARVPVVSSILRYLSSGHSRSIKIKQNILLTLLFKIPAVVLDLLILRLTLDYLEPLKYGIWITLVSIVGWLSFSDIGMGAGLRNRLAESLARNDITQARVYISTTYAMMLGLASVIVITFTFINLLIEWDWVLNAPDYMTGELSQLAFWMVFFGAYFLATGLIKVILKANQLASAAAVIDLATSILSLLAIWLLLETTSNSILLLGFWHSMMLAVLPLIAGLLFFGFFRWDLRPSLKYIDFGYSRDIWGIGGKFFIIQICSTVIFSTDSLIITHVLGPEEVTTYMIVFKYFHVLTLGFAVVSMPFWSAFTDAYVKQEYGWIRRVICLRVGLLVPVIIAAVTMFLIGRFVIEDVWLGRNLDIGLPLLSLMAVYVVVQAWNRIFSEFLSGVGVLSVTLVTMLLGAVINVPLSILLADYLGLGASGVILGTIISLSFFAFVGPVKTMFLLRQRIR
mgnify:CR=1 FL=1